MEKLNLNRRVFLAHSSAAAAAAGGCVTTVAGAAVSHAEIEDWKREVGSCFCMKDETFLLRSVSVNDYSADHARPRNLRPHSIQLLFVRQGGRSKNGASDLKLCRRSRQVSVTRVIAPQGESGEFYEGIIN